MTNHSQAHPTSLPAFLTVEEGAAVPLIGRTFACRLVRRRLATNVSQGLCAITFPFRGVTKSAFGRGVLGENDDEQG